MNPSALPQPLLSSAGSESTPLVESLPSNDYTNGHVAEEPPKVPEPIDEDRHGCEFIDGQWVEKNVGTHASFVAHRLHKMIGTPVWDQRLGFILDSDGGYARR